VEAFFFRIKVWNPCSAHSFVAAEPAGPAPITMTSNVFPFIGYSTPHQEPSIILCTYISEGNIGRMNINFYNAMNSFLYF
jgi:hypothetical protein